MQRQIVVRIGKALEQSVFQHGNRTEAQLFSGLADHDQRAGPFILASGQFTRHADPDSHVHIMPTCMHDRAFHLVPGDIGLLRCVFLAGLFRYGKGVHVRAQHDHRAGPVFHDGDHAISADTLHHLASFRFGLCPDPGIPHTRGDFKPEGFCLISHQGRAVGFLEGKLRVLMQMQIDGFQICAGLHGGSGLGTSARRHCSQRQ